MTFRQFVLLTHRWFGLASSVVLLVAGVTGAALVWPKALGPFQKPSGSLHTGLGIGVPGEWLVILATAIAVLLVAGGIVLWWKRRTLRVSVRRGWRRFLFDLHNSVGLLGAAVMLIIALSGIGLVLTAQEEGATPTRTQRATRTWVHRFHTGRRFPLPVKVAWVLGSLAFAVQGVSGVVMWWKPGTGRSAA